MPCNIAAPTQEPGIWGGGGGKARGGGGWSTRGGGGGGLGAEKIDVDKFRSPPSYQNFPSILRMLFAVLCTPHTGCREGFLCSTPPLPLRCPRPPPGGGGGGNRHLWIFQNCTMARLVTDFVPASGWCLIPFSWGPRFIVGGPLCILLSATGQANMPPNPPPPCSRPLPRTSVKQPPPTPGNKHMSVTGGHWQHHLDFFSLLTSSFLS